jgi:hypothetical protein
MQKGRFIQGAQSQNPMIFITPVVGFCDAEFVL